MKKHLTKSRMTGYILMLSAMFLSVCSLSYARFAAQVKGGATATVAAWGGGSQIDIDVSGLRPGDTKEYRFTVTNTENGITSEVGQNYSIEVDTTGNLPLEFILSAESLSGQDKGTYLADGKLPLNDGKAGAEGGFLPHTVSVSHTYILTVSWPGDQNNTDYADEIDLVTLTVNSEQAMPVRQ